MTLIIVFSLLAAFGGYQAGADQTRRALDGDIAELCEMQD